MIGITITTAATSSPACVPLKVTCRVSKASAADSARLAGYVDAHPHGTLFHHPNWCDAVTTGFGHRPRHLIAQQDGVIVGVLPLFELRSVLAGRLLVSVPYATYGGPLADDSRAESALLSAAADLARSSGARQLDLRCAEPIVADPTDALTPIDGYAVFRKQLPAALDELRTFLPRKARAAARQARDRAHLTVRHDVALLPLAWQLYARSMRRLGSLNYPFAFFRALACRHGRRAWTTVVFDGDRPIASVVSFVFRDTVLPYFLGVDERSRCTGATNLLYFGVMERAVRAQLRWFDFGRTRLDNAGAFAFKRNQGFEPRPLGYARYVPPGHLPGNLTPSNPRFALARRVWPHLPLHLTRPLGSWLSRSVAG